MFYAGTFVRCQFRGLGEVVASGEDPEVAFLFGPRVRVSGTTLTRIPAWKFERAEANFMAIERWLDLRIHGATERPVALAPRPPFDLEKAMREQMAALPLRKPAAAPGVLWFFGEDLNNTTAGEA